MLADDDLPRDKVIEYAATHNKFVNYLKYTHTTIITLKLMIRIYTLHTRTTTMGT